MTQYENAHLQNQHTEDGDNKKKRTKIRIGEIKALFHLRECTTDGTNTDQSNCTGVVRDLDHKKGRV